MNVDSIMRWERLAASEEDSLTDTRLQLHWAAQIPAAVGNSWVEPAPDWAHLSLEWLEKPRLCASQWSNTAPRFRAALRPEDLALVLLGETGSEVDSFPLDGRTIEQGRQWLQGAAAAYLGRDMDQPLQPPEHELPAHPVGQGATFTAADTEGLAELARWFANADRVLRGLKNKVTYATPVRLWPHHFDIALLVKVDPNEAGEQARSIGVGMTPGDTYFADPYWYVAPWPYPKGRELADLDGGGVWHTDGWTGAVLTAVALDDAEDLQEQAGQVLTFLYSAINAAWGLLDLPR